MFVQHCSYAYTSATCCARLQIHLYLTPGDSGLAVCVCVPLQQQLIDVSAQNLIYFY